MIQSDNNPTADAATAKTPADQKSEGERREYLNGARDFLSHLDSIAETDSQKSLLDRGRTIVGTLEKSGGPIRR